MNHESSPVTCSGKALTGFGMLWPETECGLCICKEAVLGANYIIGDSSQTNRQYIDSGGFHCIDIDWTQPVCVLSDVGEYI